MVFSFVNHTKMDYTKICPTCMEFHSEESCFKGIRFPIEEPQKIKALFHHYGRGRLQLEFENTAVEARKAHFYMLYKDAVLMEKYIERGGISKMFTEMQDTLRTQQKHISDLERQLSIMLPQNPQVIRFPLPTTTEMELHELLSKMEVVKKFMKDRTESLINFWGTLPKKGDRQLTEAAHNLDVLWEDMKYNLIQMAQSYAGNARSHGIRYRRKEKKD